MGLFQVNTFLYAYKLLAKIQKKNLTQFNFFHFIYTVICIFSLFRHTFHIILQLTSKTPCLRSHHFPGKNAREDIHFFACEPNFLQYFF